MRRRLLILIAIILGTLLLSFSLVFLRHRFEEAQSAGVAFIFSKEDYIFRLIFSILLLTIPAFILGFISWLLFEKKQSDKLFHFVIFNLMGLTLLLLANTNEIYKIWHYNKYQANIDYNESLTKRNGGFLDTCMIMAQNDIKRHGVLPNDYRILSYSYDQELTTIPRDTTNKYYSFDIIYSKNSSNTKTVRTASYFINFNHKLKRVYDVDTKDEKAKKQIERVKGNFKDLKNVLENLPDSTDNQFDKLREQLKRLD
jgi:hypothetical protein